MAFEAQGRNAEGKQKAKDIIVWTMKRKNILQLKPTLCTRFANNAGGTVAILLITYCKTKG